MFSFSYPIIFLLYFFYIYKNIVDEKAIGFIFHGNLHLPFYFSLRDDFHHPNAFRKGGLCIALMSSNRPLYMLETIQELLYYIQNYEPYLNYSLVWVDTATKNQDSLNIELSRRFHFDRKLFLTTHSSQKLHEGITTTYQLAIHLCENSDYFMPLEEDWKLIKTPKIGFLQNTMDILNEAPHQLMGIVFKNTEPRIQPEKNLIMKVKNNTYNITCEMKRKYQFVNGAAIYRMSNIKKLVDKPIPHNSIFEFSLSCNARNLGMFFGFVDFVENCKKSPGDCYGVFQHIGKVRSLF